MGGSTRQTQSTNQTTTTAPWSPTIQPLTDLTGQIQTQLGNTAPTGIETGAYNTLTSNAQAGNPYAPAIGSLATDLLSGGPDYSGNVNDAFKQYSDYLTPFANGSNLDPNNNPYYQTVSNDIANRVNGMFAGAGRDLSGANLQTLSRGIAEGVSPLYNQERQRQMDAISGLFTGANTATGLLSNLSQTSLANRGAGVDAAQSALQANDSAANQLLQIEAAKRGLPLDNISNVESLLTPIAGLGGTSNMQGTTTGTTQTPLGQQIVGGLIGGAGLLGKLGAFGPTGWLFGSR